MVDVFYIADMRPEFHKNWAITFWRPDNKGYAYPLSWAGKYSREAVVDGGDYYTTREYLGPDKWGRHLIRCAVPCEVADAIAVAPPPLKIDGDAGPVVLNTAKNRSLLRKAALVLPSPPKEPAP